MRTSYKKDVGERFEELEPAEAHCPEGYDHIMTLQEYEEACEGTEFVMVRHGDAVFLYQANGR